MSVTYRSTHPRSSQSCDRVRSLRFALCQTRLCLLQSVNPLRHAPTLAPICCHTNQILSECATRGYSTSDGRRHCRALGSGLWAPSRFRIHTNKPWRPWWEEDSSGIDAIQGCFGEVRYTVVRDSIQLACALHSSCQRL